MWLRQIEAGERVPWHSDEVSISFISASKTSSDEVFSAGSRLALLHTRLNECNYRPVLGGVGVVL